MGAGNFNIGEVLTFGLGSLLFPKDKKSDAPSPLPLPNSPDSNKASSDASTAQTRQRQIMLASGGQTDFTGGTANLLGSDVSSETLLGG